jgi:hypothetical protein
VSREDRLRARRLAAHQLTPIGDRIKDKAKWMFVKFLLIAAAIAILCLVSYSSYKGS